MFPLFRCCWLAFVTLLVTTTTSLCWTVEKIGNLEYLPLKEIAAFYGLPTDYEFYQKTTFIADGPKMMEVTLGSREVYLNGARHWMAFPVKELNGDAYISRADLSKVIEPAMRPELIKTLEPVKKVVIDAGHGGKDKGAIGPYGYEKEYALDVALRLRTLLEAEGIEVIMTREDDTFLELHERAAIANANPDALFVSIHFNASENKEAAGAEIFSLAPRGTPSDIDYFPIPKDPGVQKGTPVEDASYALSCSVHHSIVGNLAQFDRGIKRSRFAVLRLTRVPSVLVEGGFVTNPYEARHIASAAWRQNLANAVYEGIAGYQKLAENGRRQMKVTDYRRTRPSGITLRDNVESNRSAAIPLAPQE